MKSFSVKKTIQVLNYLQENAGATDFITLLKLVFFADRKMLRTWGIPITYDQYYAMKRGPVCSKTKDILNKKYDYLSISESDRELINIAIEKKEKNQIYIKNIGYSSLSPADKVALNFTINTFKKFSGKELIEITHDYPEWKKYEKQLESKKRMKMNFDDFFENPINHRAINEFLNSKDPFEENEEMLSFARETYHRNLSL